MKEQKLEEVVIKSRIKTDKEIDEEYKKEFMEKFPFKPEEVSKEDYLKMMKEYIDERYLEERDAWQDKHMSFT